MIIAQFPATFQKAKGGEYSGTTVKHIAPVEPLDGAEVQSSLSQNGDGSLRGSDLDPPSASPR